MIAAVLRHRIVTVVVILAALTGFVAIADTLVAPQYANAPFASRPTAAVSGKAAGSSSAPSTRPRRPPNTGPLPDRSAQVVRIRFWRSSLGTFAAAWFLLAATVELLGANQKDDSVSEMRFRRYLFWLSIVALGFGIWAADQVVFNPHLIAFQYRIALASVALIFLIGSSRLRPVPGGGVRAYRGDLSRLFRAAPFWASALAFVALLAMKPSRPQYGDPAVTPAAFNAWYVSQTNEKSPPSGQGRRIQLIKFNDFQCPPCKAAHDAYDRIIATVAQEHRDEFAYVLMDFPLDSSCNAYVSAPLHPAACDAAVAVRLAREHGRDQPLEDWLWANQGSLTHDSVFRAAREIAGVQDMNERYAQVISKVKADIDAGHSLGVIGTPSFFLNGVKLPPVTAGVLREIVLDRLALLQVTR